MDDDRVNCHGIMTYLHGSVILICLTFPIFLWTFQKKDGMILLQILQKYRRNIICLSLPLF